MFIEEAILTELLLKPAITDLVGKRIYYVKAPQDVAIPYLVFQKISEISTHSHQGYSHLKEARFQFSAFATTYIGSKTINAQLQTILDGFTGVMGGSGGLEIGLCLLDDETDLYEPEYKLHYSPVEYLIAYND